MKVSELEGRELESPGDIKLVHGMPDEFSICVEYDGAENRWWALNADYDSMEPGATPEAAVNACLTSMRKESAEAHTLAGAEILETWDGDRSTVCADCRGQGYRLDIENRNGTFCTTCDGSGENKNEK